MLVNSNFCFDFLAFLYIFRYLLIFLYIFSILMTITDTFISSSQFTVDQPSSSFCFNKSLHPLSPWSECHDSCFGLKKHNHNLFSIFFGQLLAGASVTPPPPHTHGFCRKVTKWLWSPKMSHCQTALCLNTIWHFISKWRLNTVNQMFNIQPGLPLALENKFVKNELKK